MLLTGVAFPQQSWRLPCRLGDIWNRENTANLRKKMRHAESSIAVNASACTAAFHEKGRSGGRCGLSMEFG
jgi:hypothetical protein